MDWSGLAWVGVEWCEGVWSGLVWCGVEWCEVVVGECCVVLVWWFGVVWCGVVWCGMVWRGEV